MFTDEFLEDVLADKDVQKVPYDAKYIMLHVIEITMEKFERENRNAAVYEHKLL